MTEPHESSDAIKPILVVLVWRGGERFQRALDSIGEAEKFFSRIVISITSEWTSDDLKIADAYVKRMNSATQASRAEIICTGKELPTMQHQAFWIAYLLKTGATLSDWIYWLAYDDQVSVGGIKQILTKEGEWPLETGTSYFGPWVVRHESAHELWREPESGEDEIWTCFDTQASLPIESFEWLHEQLTEPTYMQMSGSVTQLAQHARLISSRFPKQGPMRIELATALAPTAPKVSEFSSPVSIIYGRPNSDRANYRGQARKEDFNLLWSSRFILLRHPIATLKLATLVAANRVLGKGTERELWRVRNASP